MVEVFYALGIRHTLLAFNNANSAGGGCMEAEDGGLTAFGRKLVAEMERVGMLVDLSHTGHRTAMQVMEAATRPCLYTHSNSGAVFSHPRNVSDEEIRGRRIAPAALIWSIAEGLTMRSTLQKTALAFLNMELDVLKPVVIGDTVHVQLVDCNT